MIFLCGLLNVALGMNDKLEDIRDILCERKMDVLLCTETGIREGERGIRYAPDY